jgi:hypothetical protein
MKKMHFEKRHGNPGRFTGAFKSRIEVRGNVWASCE